MLPIKDIFTVCRSTLKDCNGSAKEELLLLCIVPVVSVVAAEGDSVHAHDVACCIH